MSHPHVYIGAFICVCEIRVYDIRGVHASYARIEKLEGTVNERLANNVLFSFFLTEILFTVCHKLAVPQPRRSVHPYLIAIHDLSRSTIPGSFSPPFLYPGPHPLPPSPFPVCTLADDRT